MDGDFKGDFTRDTFDPFKHFSRVLMQQGRVQLDADWNEQTDILLRYLRTLAMDVIGPFGGPITGSGFQILSPGSGDFKISPGHYYVDGILIEIPEVDEQGQPITVTYKHQPYNPMPDALPTDASLLIYVDVWELQISFIQDDGIREVALGVSGPDTATRALVVWQVKTLNAADFPIIKDIRDPKNKNKKIQNLETLTKQLRDKLIPANRGLLRARAKVDAEDATQVCITPPDARYRGAENQLYRVEIHNGGSVGSATGSTFKWSREDGSVVFPIDNIEGKLITLANLGRDEHLRLQKDDWVEVVDDDYVLQVFGDPNHPDAQPHPLLRVVDVDPINMTVTLNDTPTIQIHFDPDNQTQPIKHPFLCRWDQMPRAGEKLFDEATGAVEIVESQGESENDADWITLEDGVQIQFPRLPNNPAKYRTGDYWLIPARTIIGDVEWPQKADPAGKLPSVAESLSPHGVEHHYAPLAHFQLAGGEIQGTPKDLLGLFKSLVELSA
jgi:hypothetical protein